MVVSWYDRSTDENSFGVYRREDNGTWQKVSDVPTRDMAGEGGNYTWTDTTDDQSGQCYMVAAEGGFDAGSARKNVRCGPTRGSSPSRCPQIPNSGTA